MELFQVSRFINMKYRNFKPYLTYALNKDGDLVHIDSVPNGNDCACICPHCKSDLCAKNAGSESKKVHHFAHVSGVDCVGAVVSIRALAIVFNILSLTLLFAVHFFLQCSARRHLLQSPLSFHCSVSGIIGVPPYPIGTPIVPHLGQICIGL